MSADTTLVIAARNFGTRAEPRIRYTAAVVQAAEDLRPIWVESERTFDGWAHDKATRIFLQTPNQPWFSTLGRAKTFASLLRAESYIEYEKLLIIEIGEREVYLLNKHGTRIPQLFDR